MYINKNLKGRKGVWCGWKWGKGRSEKGGVCAGVVRNVE